MYDLSSLELRGSVVVKLETAGYRAAVHPSGEFMVVSTRHEICVVDLCNIDIVDVFRPPEFKTAIAIMCVQFTPLGGKCIVNTALHGTHVYKVSSMRWFEHLLTFDKMKDDTWWCDVTERQCVNVSTKKLVFWDINTGGMLKVLRPEFAIGNHYVKLLSSPQRVFYPVWEPVKGGWKVKARIVDMEGNVMTKLDTTLDFGHHPQLHFFGNYVITAESDASFRLHDLLTGKILYVLVDEQSLGFSAFIDNPATNTVRCYNNNGRCYIFEKTLV